VDWGGRGSDREHGGADAPQLRVAALLLLLCAASVQRRPVTAPGPRRRVRPVSGVGNELRGLPREWARAPFRRASVHTVTW
jgi:hypothetical protein